MVDRANEYVASGTPLPSQGMLGIQVHDGPQFPGTVEVRNVCVRDITGSVNTPPEAPNAPTFSNITTSSIDVSWE